MIEIEDAAGLTQTFAPEAALGVLIASAGAIEGRERLVVQILLSGGQKVTMGEFSFWRFDPIERLRDAFPQTHLSRQIAVSEADELRRRICRQISAAREDLGWPE